MSTPYQQDRFPYVPVLQLRLTIPRGTAGGAAVAALIDTGADFTLVPLTWLVQLDAPESRYAYVRGLWSEPRQVTLYLVDLHLTTGCAAGC